MKLLGRRTFGLVGAIAVALAVGASTQALPASATAPVNAHNYPDVLGINGSAASVHDMQPSTGTRLEVVGGLAPEDLSTQGGASNPMTVTEWRVAENGRKYVQIKGHYCTNKSGGDVFVADGAPVDSGLTC